MSFPFKWRYTDNERPLCVCADCRLPYPQGNDCAVPDDIWEKINPSESEGGGILCANCIMRRLDHLGISGVPATLW
ncbi:MAG TPA: hypothetical protein VLB68_29110 [Pyrinomonadaceae bacterium]|nr:hypothetical protein [Pyrinomonadaceae bacterium]